MTRPVLRVQLLGGFNVVYNNVPVIGANPARLQSLLAYLILHADVPQSRQHIAFLLWPDASESHARNNFRQLLHQLRQALPEPDRFLVADANTIGWQTDEGQVVDIQRFERTLSEADASEQRGDKNALRQMLERAVACYQGDLVPSCYDDWIAPERERLRQQCQTVYQKLAALFEAQREYAAAVQAAQQLLRLDPLDENTYIRLMRLHHLNHNRSGVWRIYQQAVETLRRELEVAPGEALREAYARYQRAAETSSTLAQRDTPADTSLTLVGRQAEWQQLQATWQRTTKGDAQLALVTGEAGIGKSRLAEELYHQVKQQGLTAAHTRSYAAEGRLSLAPVTEWLRSAALRPHLNVLDKLCLTEIARLLPELLSEYADLARPEPIGEYGQRQRFFEALARAVLAAPRPALLWIDDLQWCDPETLEWLRFLLRFEPRSALLVLGTARSEESPPNHPSSVLARQLRSEGKLMSVELSPLDAAETARLASQIQGRELDVAATMHLFRETEGNPLFVVETMRAGIGRALAAEASATTPADPESQALPPRVHAVIAERLAQLSPTARRVAELGAAIGRAFSLDVLLHAGQDDETSTVHALDELWQKRIVREQSANAFDFTHDKLREVAYTETSAPQRRLFHRRIAQALEVLNGGNLDLVSAQIAAQYEQAGLFAQALPYYQRAGELAASMYANEDAIRLLTHGLVLLSGLPADAKRDAQELAFLLALAPAYCITKGWASPDLKRLADRARSLADAVGSVFQRVVALYLQRSVNSVAARFDEVLETDAEMRLLEAQESAIAPLDNTVVVVVTRLFTGHFTEARELLERLVVGHDKARIRYLQAIHGVNYLALAHAMNAQTLWCLGYPQQALASCEESVRVAREFEQPFSEGLALTYLAMLQELCADLETFHTQAEAALDFTRKYRAHYYHAWASILAQFARAWRQPGDEALSLLRNAIHVFIETGARVRLPYYYSLLARACQHAGRMNDALAALEQAFAESQRSKEQWWDAELHRLRGELRWSQGAGADEIEAAFLRSLEIARSQQARSLELRAVTSLARLWQATGRSEAAKQLLAPLHGWFTEGFDTPDLQAAQSLLAQL